MHIKSKLIIHNINIHMKMFSRKVCFQQIQEIEPILILSWLTLYEAGPALKLH